MPLVAYANMPGLTATLVSARLANLEQLQTIYNAQDAYNLLEIHMVDNHNRGLLNGNSD